MKLRAALVGEQREDREAQLAAHQKLNKFLEKHVKDILKEDEELQLCKQIFLLQYNEFQLSQLLQSLMQESTLDLHDMITLNIGGSKFITTKSSLLKMEGSFFHAMLTSSEWLPNEMGRYLIAC